MLLVQTVERAVLQLWRLDLISCLHVSRPINFRTVQVAPIRTGSHPACGRVVPAFCTVLPRRRRTLGRTRDFGRSRHRLALGTALCPGNQSTFAVGDSNQPTTVGAWTKLMCALKASGCTCTEPWTPAVRRSTSFFRPNAMQQRLSAFWPKPSAVRT